MGSMPAYQIRVTNPQTGDTTLLLPLVNSYALKYEIELNKITSFALTLPYQDSYESVFVLDSIVDILRTDPEGNFQTEGSYLVRMTERSESDADERIVVSGFHANHLLKRRYVDPADDSVQPNGGYATKSGVGGDIIRAYIREQAGDLASTDRQTEGLSVPAPLNGGLNTGGNFRFTNLWDELVTMANAANIEINIEHAGNRAFNCIIGTLGTNRSLDTINEATPSLMVFNPERGNMQSPSLTIDRRKEVNFIRVQGAGARENRTSLSIPGTTLIDSVYNRIENTVDARGTNDTDSLGLYLEGLKYLNTNRQLIDFKFEPLFNTGGAVYRTNFFWGDTVTAQWGNTEQTLRVKKISFEVSEDNETLTIGLENEQ